MLDVAEQIGVLIDSLFGQDFDGPWEIIAVDNGSQDRTVELVRELLASNPPANLVRCEVVLAPSPRGYATPRNAGVRLSSAPLLAFCDADGAVDGQWLSSIVSALQSEPLVGSRKYRSTDVSNRDPDAAFFELKKFPEIFGIPFAGTGGLGCTMELFDALGGFDPYFDLGGEDIDFSLRARFSLGIEPVMEQSAVYWSKYGLGMRKKFLKGYRDGRTIVRLYHRHLGRHSEPASGPITGLLRLLRIIWSVPLRGRGEHWKKIANISQLGNVCGRAVWSLRLRVRCF